RLISTAIAEIANHSLRRPMMSSRQRTFWPLAPMKEALLNHFRPASRFSISRVANTAVNVDTITPTASVNAKPLTVPLPDTNSTRRRDQRHDVGVDDRVEALRVAGRDRRSDRSAEAYLFLDALEDDDVRVGRDADGQDGAGDARQRERDRDQDRDAVEER